jgi:hypothetical protein
MSFDSEGNYFDEKTITVYHEQRKEVFGILTFSLFVIVLGLINFIRANECGNKTSIFIKTKT